MWISPSKMNIYHEILALPITDFCLFLARYPLVTRKQHHGNSLFLSSVNDRATWAINVGLPRCTAGYGWSTTVSPMWTDCWRKLRWPGLKHRGNFMVDRWGCRMSLYCGPEESVKSLEISWIRLWIHNVTSTIVKAPPIFFLRGGLLCNSKLVNRKSQLFPKGFCKVLTNPLFSDGLWWDLHWILIGRREKNAC